MVVFSLVTLLIISYFRFFWHFLFINWSGQRGGDDFHIFPVYCVHSSRISKAKTDVQVFLPTPHPAQPCRFCQLFEIPCIVSVCVFLSSYLLESSMWYDCWGISGSLVTNDLHPHSDLILFKVQSLFSLASSHCFLMQNQSPSGCGLWTNTNTWLWGVMDPNSCWHVCAASTIPTEQSPLPHL